MSSQNFVFLMYCSTKYQMTLSKDPYTENRLELLIIPISIAGFQSAERET